MKNIHWVHKVKKVTKIQLLNIQLKFFLNKKN
jgi:hypothetical protein